MYFNAYLLMTGYSVYRHLFGLDDIMPDQIPKLWYNSVFAVDMIKLINNVMSDGINPIVYLSSLFSSFRYQFDTYHRLYNSDISRISLASNVRSRCQKIWSSDSAKDRYYFAGNPVLDLDSHYFDLSFISVRPYSALMGEIKFNWINYLRKTKRLLRMPEYAFRTYFYHRPTDRELKMIYSDDYLDWIRLTGVPDDSECFGFCSDRLWRYTHGYQKHLYGLEDYYRDTLDIRPYKLYSINVARDELRTIKRLIEY